ncbi:MAG: glycoside hydrolase family 2, partial [Dysgonamonadaceae bacterium]|nr:glycoside hydrolase family 2 [Dysgonamonadaceae bacterium]
MTTKKNLFSLVFILLNINTFAQISFGQPELINNQWQFYLGDNPTEKTRWQAVDLPHDWSVRESLSPSLASCQGFLPCGIGWYRKTLFVPQDRQNEKLYLYFEGVYNRSEVFVNGQSVGSRPNGYISFAYDITPFVRFGKENEISVRVDHSQSADSRWYTGSGIYRNVWLVRANPVHIAQWGVFAFGDDFKALKVIVEIANESSQDASLTIINELFSPNGNSVAKNSRKISVETLHATSLQTQLPIKNPQLWDLEHPNLYTLKTTLLQNGKVIDETATTTAFRSLIFDAGKGFLLNGKPLKLKGGCIHHDNGLLGATSIDRAEEKKVELLKSNGFNAVRCAHNPPAEKFLEACDRLGLLVIDEAFDQWQKMKNPQDYHRFFDKWHEKDLASMVRRDRNHPSVIMWSIGNEIQERADSAGVEIAKKLKAIIRQYDTTRPITAAINDFWDNPNLKWKDSERTFLSLDVCGYNYMWREYENDLKSFPNRIIYGSESTAMERAANWDLVEKHPSVIGDFIWTAIDYLGESGIGHALEV